MRLEAKIIYFIQIIYLVWNMKAVFSITESKNYVQPSTQVQKYLAAQNSKLQLHSAGFLFTS